MSTFLSFIQGKLLAGYFSHKNIAIKAQLKIFD